MPSCNSKTSTSQEKPDDMIIPFFIVYGFFEYQYIVLYVKGKGVQIFGKG
jgi:hypothetical protein